MKIFTQCALGVDMKTRDLHTIAEAILDEDPDPAVRYRLLSEVLRCAPTDGRLKMAKKDLDNSRHVQLLLREQHSDGSWGRFHSRDYSSDQETPTTECGVTRAVSLGLDRSHPILKQAGSYCQAVLSRRIAFPDRAERNDRWETGWRLFTAATLSQIQPTAPILKRHRKLWIQIVERTFASDRYDHEAQRQAHRELTGVGSELRYLGLAGRHHLLLLGSRADQLPRRSAKHFVDWLWHERGRIGYLESPFTKLPTGLKGRFLSGWFTSHELLVPFPAWRSLAGNLMQWLWIQRDKNGHWDFGPRPSGHDCVQLSETWREPSRRQHDWSTRVLILLSRYLDNSFGKS